VVFWDLHHAPPDLLRYERAGFVEGDTREAGVQELEETLGWAPT
jgi:hypothetical protein